MFVFPGVRQGFRVAVAAAATVAAFIALTGWSTSSASAAEIWVSPDGGSWPCIESDPCSLEGAVSSGMISDGDSLLLTQGVHSITPETSLYFTPQVDIGPAPGAGRPVISQPQLATATSAIVIFNAGSHIHDLAITVNGGGGALHLSGGVADRLAVEVNGQYGYGITAVNNAVVSNTVIRMAGENSIGAISGAPSTRIVNSTIYGTAPGTIGVGSNTCYGGHTVEVINSLVEGAAQSFRMLDQCEPGTHSITTTAKNSAFNSSKIVTAGVNQTFNSVNSVDTNTVAPGLNNAPLGDFRLTAASPLIDAGSIDDVVPGSLDNLGRERVQGDGVDIGAFEFPVKPKLKLKAKRVSKGKKIKLRIRCDVACPRVKVKGGVKPKTVRNAKAGKWKKVTLKVKKPAASKLKVKVTAFDVDGDRRQRTVTVRR